MSENRQPHPPGQFATVRSAGTNASEKFLVRLVERTFLSAWSYPNVWRDQRAAGGAAGDGKEVCDVLVVFDNHVVIFSDKHIKYNDGADPIVAWNRWYKAAVERGAAQVLGAERWLRQYPNRLFLDSKCTKRFPLELPPADRISFHRIAVARGAGSACRQHFGGGSGSMMIVPSRVGDQHLLPRSTASQSSEGDGPPRMPFAVGYPDEHRRYVHVLDDVSLSVLMQTLDTVQDFIEYLSSKEKFIESGRLVSATGEEELLAYYLKHTDPSGRHDFILGEDVDGLFFPEGGWDEFRAQPQRVAQIEANKRSYLWDQLIERFAFHALNDTQHYATERGIAYAEVAMRFLARECRTRRRMLAEAILGLIERTRRRNKRFDVRVVLPSRPGEPHYVFAAARHRDESYEEYRERRRSLLQNYLIVLRGMRPDALDIVGVAFGAHDGDRSDASEDLIYLDGRDWTEEQQQEAVELQRTTGILSRVKWFEGVTNEYPDSEDEAPRSMPFPKGRDRNRPCPCGSGLKWKKCHGLGQ